MLIAGCHDNGIHVSAYLSASNIFIKSAFRDDPETQKYGLWMHGAPFCWVTRFAIGSGGRSLSGGPGWRPGKDTILDEDKDRPKKQRHTGISLYSEYQPIPSDGPDFEVEALHACDLLLNHDRRLGRIPESRR